MFISFALILNILKQDVFDCANIIDLEKVLREKALLIDDYDFFCVLFDYSKDKNWKDSFSLMDGESLRANFMAFDKVKADTEADKVRKYEEMKAMNPSMDIPRQDPFSKLFVCLSF